MIIYVDIDDTICYQKTKPGNWQAIDYTQAIPILENIAKINKLFDEGHTIIYWSARGATTGKNWFDLTQSQLKRWGAKYDRLSLDKPFYDRIIDDKAFKIEDIK